MLALVLRLNKLLFKLAEGDPYEAKSTFWPWFFTLNKLGFELAWGGPYEAQFSHVGPGSPPHIGLDFVMA